MTLEEELRRTLTDERRALPGWDDPVRRVRTGMVRRRRRRVATVAAVVSTLLAAPAAVLVPVAITNPAWRIEDFPWLSPAAPTPPLSARSCTAGQLGPAASARSLGPADGYERYQVTVRNSSTAACLLSGRPDLGSQESGGVQAVPTVYDNPPDDQGTDGGDMTSVLLAPGAAASATVATSTACADSDHPAVYRDLVLSFLDNRLPLPGLILTTTCVITVSVWSADRG